MKKSKIKLLSVAACLALVGTASAAWAYAGTASASASIGVKVAAYADAGSITINGADKISVLLDNGSVSYVSSDGSNTLSATYTAPTGVDTDGKTVNMSYQMVISPRLYEYITFGSGVTTEDSYIGDSATVCTASTTYTSGTNIFSTLPALTWQTDKCPTTEEAYKSFVSTVANGQYDADEWNNNQTTTWDATSETYYISIQFTAKVVDA